MKKPILLSLALAALFFLIVWIAFPFLNSLLLKGVIGSAKATVISASYIGEEQTVGIKTALSFAILPLVSGGIFLLIRKIKNAAYPLRKLGIILLIISIGYFIGAGLKFVLLSTYITKMEAYRLSPAIRNSISLGKIYFYDCGLIVAGIFALLIFLFAKRK